MVAAECDDVHVDAYNCSCHVAQSTAARASAPFAERARASKHRDAGFSSRAEGPARSGRSALPGYRVVYHASGESYTQGACVCTPDNVARNDRVARRFMLGEIVFGLYSTLCRALEQATTGTDQASAIGMACQRMLPVKADTCARRAVVMVRRGECCVTIGARHGECTAHANAEASDSRQHARTAKRPSRRMSMSDKAGLCEQSSAVILQQLIMAEMLT